MILRNMIAAASERQSKREEERKRLTVCVLGREIVLVMD